MSPPVNPNDLTRHQLDELDALLQRMLSLPLGGPPPAGASGDDRPAALTMPEIPPLPAPSGGGNWRNDAAPAHRLPHAPQVMGDANTLTWGHDAPARSTPANFHVPTLSTLPPPSVEVIPDTIPLFGPPAEARTLRGVDAPALPPNYRREPVADVLLVPAPAPVHAAAAMFAPPGAAAPAGPVPAAVWPVYAVNSLLETGLGLCGPFGKLVTNRTSKHLLGWTGVALLAASAVWVARGYGLIDFPLPTTGSVASAPGR